jgi:circadian clock protein KaiA
LDTLSSHQVDDRYVVAQFNSIQDLHAFLTQGTSPIDCLILQETPDLPQLFKQLQQQSLLFPAVIIQAEFSFGSKSSWTDSPILPTPTYHSALVQIPVGQLHQIGLAIDRAIAQFIQLTATEQLGNQLSPATDFVDLSVAQLSPLKVQQLRLAEKLKERLGYLGVYYKRNPQNFLRHMTPPQREELLQQLREEYREIILTYFSDAPGLNQKIDSFVNVAFFADVPVSQIVEIHMDLMDAFAKQLKLEGRSEEILLDYRLTLIDTIAHLCEMYRRSIPRES